MGDEEQVNAMMGAGKGGLLSLVAGVNPWVAGAIGGVSLLGSVFGARNARRNRRRQNALYQNSRDQVDSYGRSIDALENTISSRNYNAEAMDLTRAQGGFKGQASQNALYAQGGQAGPNAARMGAIANDAHNMRSMTQAGALGLSLRNQGFQQQTSLLGQRGNVAQMHMGINEQQIGMNQRRRENNLGFLNNLISIGANVAGGQYGQSQG